MRSIRWVITYIAAGEDHHRKDGLMIWRDFFIDILWYCCLERHWSDSPRDESDPNLILRIMSASDPLHKYENIRQAFRVFHLLWVNLYFITYTNSRFNDIWSLWIEIHPLMVRRTLKLRNRITPDHAKRGMEKCKHGPLVDIPPTLAAVRRICWSIYYFWKFLCWGTAYCRTSECHLWFGSHKKKCYRVVLTLGSRVRIYI